MCWDGDGPDFMSETTRRARKAHRCEECGLAIPAGTRYVYIVGKWDGIQAFAIHVECRALAARLGALLCDGSYAFGELHEHVDVLERWEPPRWKREGTPRPEWDKPTFIVELGTVDGDPYRVVSRRETEDVIEEEKPLLLLQWEAIQQKYAGHEFEVGGEA